MRERFSMPRAVGVAALLSALLLTSCSRGPDVKTVEPPAESTESSVSAQSAMSADEDQVESVDPEVAARTEPVAAPGGGDVQTEVDAGEQELLPAADFGQNVDVSGLVVDVLDIQKATVQARMAGETSGPGVIVTVQIRNNSADAINVGAATVAGKSADGAPLVPMSGTPSQPFFGQLDAGGSADATYAFRTYSQDEGGSFTITVNPAPNLPVAVFTGAIS